MKIKLEPVGFVFSSRSEVQDDSWDSVKSYIDLTNNFSEKSLLGLLDFSHVEIIFYMHKVVESKIQTKSRYPRNNKDWPEVGIFSQRGKNRPNKIGHTICELIHVDKSRLYLKGLDAINGTPVLDIKPWVNEFGPRGKVKQPRWISELMAGYW